MMFDPPDYPYKELQETYEAHNIFNREAEQTIPASSSSITGVTEHIIQSEENQSFHSNDSGRYFNIENSLFQDVNSNIAEQNTELYVVQSENLFNYEPTLLDDNTVNQFLLPLQESSDTLKDSNNNGPDILALHSCIVCHEIFTTEADLLDHTISVHTSEAGDLDQTLTPTDSVANNVIHSIQSGETSGNMNFETEWLVCRICERVLSTALEIEPTEQLCCIVENEKGSVLSRKLHTMYVCDYCSGLFADGDAMDRHRLTCIIEDHTRYHSDIDVSPSAQYTDICFNCDACGQRYSSSEELKFHSFQCPRMATRSGRRSYSSSGTNKMWNCGSCNQLFTTARELYRHKRGEDRPSGAPLMAYVCEDCDKVLGSMCALHTHKKMHKVSKPGYPCRVCGRRFNQSGHLAIHMRMHTGERPYPCDLCPKAFKVKVERDDHRRTHTGERPFACAACPKTFTAAARLREHARIHTDHRPYRCDICGAAFRRPYARTVHTLIHTGAKPHECDVCGTAFRRSGDMWKHKRTLHGVQAGAETVPKSRN